MLAYKAPVGYVKRPQRRTIQYTIHTLPIFDRVRVRVRVRFNVQMNFSNSMIFIKFVSELSSKRSRPSTGFIMLSAIGMRLRN